jgi:hypothetical protein
MIFANDIKELPDNEDCFIAPEICPICGSKVIEMPYDYECEGCEWAEPKKNDN